MEYRELGRTGYKVSTISFGAWAIGGALGSVPAAKAFAKPTYVALSGEMLQYVLTAAK